MELPPLSPYIRVAMDSRITPPWHIRERVIFDYELMYVKEGEVSVTIEDETFRGVPGDLFLFKPGQRHSLRVDEGPVFRQPHLHFDLFERPDSPEVKVSFKPLEQMSETERSWFRDDVTDKPGFRFSNRIPLKNAKLFEEMLFQIIKEREMKLPYHEIQEKGLFLSLWTHLLREQHWIDHREAHSRMKDLLLVKEYLDAQDDAEVTLDQLSATFNISKFHLSKLFTEAFSIPPIRYHRMRRLRKARELIQFSDRSLTEIAEQQGFGSLYAFSRAFREAEGVPPSFYRRRG